MTRKMKSPKPHFSKWNFYMAGPIGFYRGSDVMNVIAVTAKQRRYVRFFWRIFRRQA